MAHCISLAPLYNVRSVTDLGRGGNRQYLGVIIVIRNNPEHRVHTRQQARGAFIEGGRAAGRNASPRPVSRRHASGEDTCLASILLTQRTYCCRLRATLRAGDAGAALYAHQRTPSYQQITPSRAAVGPRKCAAATHCAIACHRHEGRGQICHAQFLFHHRVARRVEGRVYTSSPAAAYTRYAALLHQHLHLPMTGRTLAGKSARNREMG